LSLATQLWVGAGMLAALLLPAAAQVISIGEDGSSQTLCTAGQNARVTGNSAYGRSSAVYRNAMDRAGRRYDLSPDLLDVLARQESHYNPRAVSAKGAIGIMQLMPATAKALGVNPFDPEQNILGGAAYLRYMLDAYDGRIDLALSAYNAGQGAVDHYGGIPPFKETRVYLLRNFENLAQKSDLQPSVAAASEETGYIQNCRQ